MSFFTINYSADNTPSGIGIFIPPLHEIIISSICLAIIIIVIVKVAVPRFYKILDTRKAHIEDKINNANKLFEDAKQIEQKNIEEMQKIKSDTTKIHRDAILTAKKIIQTAKYESEKEYNDMIKNANVKIESDKKQMYQKAENIAKKTAQKLAEKILKNALKDKQVYDKVFDNMVK
jgi:F-type H+-transporting ATPase subunit b